MIIIKTWCLTSGDLFSFILSKCQGSFSRKLQPVATFNFFETVRDKLIAVRALILSRLDYCNALFLQLSAKDISRLQRLQNSAARVIFAVGRRVEAHPLVSSLHWLSIDKRISFKILLYIYKSFNSLAPKYISNKLTPYIPQRTLRSSNDTTRLLADRSISVAGDRRFPVAGVKRWNSLPIEIRLSPSVTLFKQRRKTYLFWTVLFWTGFLMYLFFTVSATMLSLRIAP